jgi:hypothetical protein
MKTTKTIIRLDGTWHLSDYDGNSFCRLASDVYYKKGDGATKPNGTINCKDCKNRINWVINAIK